MSIYEILRPRSAMLKAIPKNCTSFMMHAARPAHAKKIINSRIYAVTVKNHLKPETNIHRG